MTRQKTFEVNINKRRRFSPGAAIRVLIHRLRNIDGIDEFAAGMAQINGITGPIAAEAVFVGGLPFVFLGFLGMIGECKEAREEFKELMESKQATIDSVVKLAEKYRHYQNSGADALMGPMKDKQFLKNAFTFYRRAVRNLAVTDTHVYDLAVALGELKDAKANEPIKTLDKNFGPIGVAAMGGMTAAVVAGAASSAMEIANVAMGGGTAVGAAADVTGLVMAGIFLPANAAMSIFGAGKFMSGIAQNRVYKRDISRLDYLQSSVSHDALSYADTYLRNQRKYNFYNKTLYGGVTSVSQALIVAGACMSLGGVTAPGATVVTGIGVAGSISAAGGRIYTEHKYEHFLGNADKVKAEDRVTFMATYANAMKGKPEGADVYRHLASHCGAEVENKTYDVAKAKLGSLMLGVILSKKFDNPMHAAKMMEERLKDGKKSFFSGTSLTKDVLDLMQRIYKDEGYSRLLSQDRAGALESLMEKQGWTSEGIRGKLEHHGREQAFAQKLAKKTKSFLREIPGALTTGDKKQYFNLDAYESAMERTGNAGLTMPYYETAMKMLAKAEKNAAKVHRMDAVGNLVKASRVMKLHAKSCSVTAVCSVLEAESHQPLWRRMPEPEQINTASDMAVREQGNILLELAHQHALHTEHAPEASKDSPEYKQTMERLYRRSPLMMPKASQEVAGRHIEELASLLQEHICIANNTTDIAPEIYSGIGVESVCIRRNDGKMVGIRVTKVLPGSPAAEAGIKENMVVTSVDGVGIGVPGGIQTMKAFNAALRGRIGSRVVIGSSGGNIAVTRDIINGRAFDGEQEAVVDFTRGALPQVVKTIEKHNNREVAVPQGSFASRVREGQILVPIEEKSFRERVGKSQGFMQRCAPRVNDGASIMVGV